MIKVSVIIPIYNAGKYLNDCLEALLAQTLKEIEFILVIDCPTDGSDIVAKRYAQFDSRFIIVENKENLHIGNSRNKGISIARGEYLAFCDHDDIMDSDMYERMYNEAISQNVEILISHPTWDINGEKHPLTILPMDKENIQKQILSDLLSSGGPANNITPFCYIHNNIYKHSLIQKNSLRFIDTKNMTPEDVLFNIEAIYCAKKIAYLPYTLYYHRIITESTGHQSYYQEWKGRFNGLNYVYEWLTRNHLYSGTTLADFQIMVQEIILDGLLSTLLKHKWSDFFTAFCQARQYPFTHDAMKHYLDQQPRPFLKKAFRRFICITLAL